MQDKARHAACVASQQTPEIRVARLQQMRGQQEERHAAETPEQRVARLQQMRDRHAAETLENMHGLVHGL